MSKIKKYENGATLVYRHRKRKHTSVAAGFVFGNNRDKYPEPTAHFCEHMLFKETETKDEQQLRQAMMDTFSMLKNAHTNPLNLRIEFCRSNKALKPCFELASEMLLKTKFSKKCVNSEKGVIKQELVRKLTNPQSVSYYTHLRNIRTKCNKNTLVLGSEEEIDAMTSEILKQFRDENFVSQNFIIAIEGGISYLKAKRYAEKCFIKNLKSDPNYPADIHFSIPSDREGNLLVENYDVNKAICCLHIKIDGIDQNNFVYQNNCADMLCRICNGLEGKLFCLLRDNGLVYSTAMIRDLELKEGAINIDFSCSVENVNKVVDKIGELFEDLRNNPVEEQRIEKIKLNRKLSKDEEIQNIFPTRQFTNFNVYGDFIFQRQYKKEDKKIWKNLTPTDVQKFSQDVFSKPENVYMSILTNAKPESFYSYEEIQNILTKNKKPKKKDVEKAEREK